MADYQNQFNQFLFKKDLFSNYKDKYNKVKNNKFQLSKILKLQKQKKWKIYHLKSGSNTNSNIYLLKYKNKKIIVKKEKINKKNFLSEKKRIDILRKKKNNFIIPPEEKIIFNNNSLWTFYKFFVGTTFKGSKVELNILAKNIYKIHDSFKMFNLKVKTHNYFSDDDINIVNLYKNKISLSKSLFCNNKKIYYQFFSKVFFIEWEIQKKKYRKIKKLKKRLCHNDIHPKNILFINKRFKIIDLKSIKKIPMEFAISYSALKLCRQSIVFEKTKKYFETGLQFINTIKKTYSVNLSKKILVSDFATIEALRRICFILRKNYCGDKSFNHILPLLISNIVESKKLFKNLTF